MRPSPPQRKGVFIGGYLKRGLVYEVDTVRKANGWTQTEALEKILAAGLEAMEKEREKDVPQG